MIIKNLSVIPRSNLPSSAAPIAAAQHHRLVAPVTSIVLGLALTLAIMGWLAHQAQALGQAVITVCPTPGSCNYVTIQEAVNAAEDGSEIRIGGPAIYTGGLGMLPPAGYLGSTTITQVVYISKNLTLRGGFNAADFNAAIDTQAFSATIDAESKGRGIFLAPGVTVTLEGLNVTNGNATDLGGCPGCDTSADRGGGIYGVTATLVMSNSAVYGNVASTSQLTTAGGGGVYLAYGALTMNNSAFRQNNGAGRGGGVFASTGLVSINDSQFADNVAGEGGGIYISTAQGVLLRNTFERNAAQTFGGGLSLDSSQLTMTQNLIRANQTAVTSLSAGGAGLAVTKGQYVIVNNTISDNNSNALGGGITAIGCVCGQTLVQISGNRITGNMAVIAGGGILAGVSGGIISGNIITGNRAGLAPGTMGAGAIAISDGGQYQVINNLIADNAVGATAEGSALAVAGAQAQLIHNTIARNSGGAIGIAIIVTGGVLSPLTGTVNMVNNIVFSHTVGLLAVQGNQLTTDGTLLFANGVDALPGPISSTNPVTGDPKFDADGYHLLVGSAASGQGRPSAVTTDIDGKPRSASAPTIGAVELGSSNMIFIPLVSN